jgi:hypothetical protein
MTLRKNGSPGNRLNAICSQMTDTFDPFLLAPVGVEENGMEVSVLSTLARLGLDPWEEAGRLAMLPKNAAIEVITRHLSLKSSSLIAVQLAALLPKAAMEPGHHSRIDRGHDIIRRNPLLWLAFWLVSCIAFLILQPHI